MTAMLDTDLDAGLNTIIIPSKGRLNQLLSYLVYLSAHRVPYRIVVLESGDQYPDLAAAFSMLRLTHTRYADQTPVRDKLIDVLARTDTPFVSLCTDDDITTWAGIRASVEFLHGNPDYSACQGYHAMFSIAPPALNLLRVVWFTPGLNQPSPLRRLNELLRRYQPICWATFRTDSLRRTFLTASQLQMFVFGELAWSGLTAIDGRVHRLPLVYCWRRIDPLNPMGHPLYAWMESPEEFRVQYERYRQFLLDALSPMEGMTATQLTRVFDLMHWRYFAREFDFGVIDHFIGATLDKPDLSVLDTEATHAFYPALPRTDSGWSAEAQRADRVYRVFAGMLDPEPRREIQLPLATLEALLQDLDMYPLL